MRHADIGLLLFLGLFTKCIKRIDIDYRFTYILHNIDINYLKI